MIFMRSVIQGFLKGHEEVLIWNGLDKTGYG